MHVQGYPVGGMTTEEAAVSLIYDFQFNEHDLIALRHLEKPYGYTPKELGISIDAVQFLHAAARALKFGKQGLWWQAGNSFASALSCWDKFILTEYFLSDQALDFSDEIRDTLRAICLTWSNRLIELNRPEEALLMLENTERLLSADEDYILLRYQLYQQKHNPLKARDILKTYRQELLRLGYSEDEADEAVIFLIDSACP